MSEDKPVRKQRELTKVRSLMIFVMIVALVVILIALTTDKEKPPRNDVAPREMGYVDPAEWSCNSMPEGDPYGGGEEGECMWERITEDGT